MGLKSYVFTREVLKWMNITMFWVLYYIRMAKLVVSGVARAFPGGRVAHPEGQNEEENEKILRKNKEKW